MTKEWQNNKVSNLSAGKYETRRGYFIMQCSALGYINNEILVYILPLKMVTYYFVVPKGREINNMHF